MLSQAQGLKTITVDTAGTLHRLLAQEYSTTTILSVSGTIDARDFSTMRNMPSLAVIDLSTAKVKMYVDSIITVNIDTLGDTTTTHISDTVGLANMIPNSAFYKDTKLLVIILSDSVSLIGNNAFESCTGLTSVTISKSIKTIGSYAFMGCTALSSITIPDSVTSIGDYAFKSCSGLKSIVIPPSISTIGEGVFYDCTGLTSVAIPTSVTSIGIDAFEPDSSLTSISIPWSVNTIKRGAFYQCNGLTSVNVPSSVTYIGVGAFEYCTRLQSLTIGASVTAIDSFAFYGCTNLSSIYAQNPIPANVHKGVFAGDTIPGFIKGVDTNTCILYVPIGSASEYKTANQWKAFNHVFENITFLESASTQKIAITTTEDWTATISPNVSWLSIKPTSGKAGIDTLVVTSTADNNSPFRYATISISYMNGTKDTVVQTIGISQTVVPQVTASTIALYPNPASSYVVVNAEANTNVLIYSNNGTLVLSKQISGTETISVSTLPTGLYFVALVTDKGIVTKKLVVK